jgi:hypothetical protein
MKKNLWKTFTKTYMLSLGYLNFQKLIHANVPRHLRAFASKFRTKQQTSLSNPNRNMNQVCRFESSLTHDAIRSNSRLFIWIMIVLITWALLQVIWQSPSPSNSKIHTSLLLVMWKMKRHWCDGICAKRPKIKGCGCATTVGGGVVQNMIRKLGMLLRVRFWVRLPACGILCRAASGWATLYDVSLK